jgi:hypothetical protein
MLRVGRKYELPNYVLSAPTNLKPNPEGVPVNDNQRNCTATEQQVNS